MLAFKFHNITEQVAPVNPTVIIPWRWLHVDPKTTKDLGEKVAGTLTYLGLFVSSLLRKSPTFIEKRIGILKG